LEYNTPLNLPGSWELLLVNATLINDSLAELLLTFYDDNIDFWNTKNALLTMKRLFKNTFMAMIRGTYINQVNTCLTQTLPHAFQ